MWKQKTFLFETNIKTSWEQELYYSELYPPNTIVEWADTDKPEDAMYEKDIKYIFNEYGFRSDSFDCRSDINILTCGCSHTVGTGVDQQESWSFALKEKVSSYTGKTVSVWNLATSGASPDYVVRSIYKTINILNPTFVCVFWPPITRLELPDETDDRRVKQTFVKRRGFPREFVNENWLHDYTFMKNLNMAESICGMNGIKFISNAEIKTVTQTVGEEYFPPDSSARDGMHPGPEWHKSGAEFYFSNIKKHL